jgi:predicted nucleic acid-binding protein
MIVVADTGPVNYLVLSGQIDLVHDLYGTLLIPPAVHRELLDARAPAPVRQWATTPPAWTEVRSPKDASRFTELGPGEREAISLALETKADFLLIDETKGRATAVQHGVAVKGTLGLLEEADVRRLVDFPQALAKLRATTIFLSEEIVQDALRRYRDRHQEQHQGHQQTPEHDHGIER